MTSPPDRRRGGRPPKAPPERRTAAILVRLTPAERAAVQARAKEARLPPSTFIRDAALGVPIRPPRQVGGVDVGEAIRQLARLGNNLNQLAREAHAGQLPALEQQLLAALGEVNAAAMRLPDLTPRSQRRRGAPVRYPTAEEAESGAEEDPSFWEPLG